MRTCLCSIAIIMMLGMFCAFKHYGILPLKEPHTHSVSDWVAAIVLLIGVFGGWWVALAQDIEELRRK